MKIVDVIVQFLLAASINILAFFNPAKARAGKRAMFLTSVYTNLVNDGVLQEMSLEDFNKAFRLADDASALEAARVASVVWDNKNLQRKFDDCAKQIDDLDTKESRLRTVESFCPTIIASTPKWMRYDDATMQQELTDVLLLSGFRKEVKDDHTLLT